MVGHEHKGMNSAPTTSGSAFKNFQVRKAIIVIEEAHLSVVSALCDVLWDVRQIQAPWSGHELVSLRKAH
jgi:hypothetical protein